MRCRCRIHGFHDLRKQFGVDGVAAEGGGACDLGSWCPVFGHEHTHLRREPGVTLGEPHAVGVAVFEGFYLVSSAGGNAAPVEVFEVVGGGFFSRASMVSKPLDLFEISRSSARPCRRQDRSRCQASLWRGLLHLISRLRACVQ